MHLARVHADFRFQFASACRCTCVGAHLQAGIHHLNWTPNRIRNQLFVHSVAVITVRNRVVSRSIAKLQTFARHLHVDRAKTVVPIIVLSVAIGVGSLTGVRGFSTSFRHMLLGEARTLMAGDLTARVFALPTAQQEAALRGLEARGVRRTWITETVTMASSASTPDPLLISVKAVDPAAYPYYGVVKLNPPRPLREALDAQAVVVSDDLL